MKNRIFSCAAVLAGALLTACASGAASNSTAASSGNAQLAVTSSNPNGTLTMIMCSEPEQLDTAGWHQTTLGVLKVKVPRGFHVADQQNGFQLYRMGEHRQVGLFWGRDPFFLDPEARATLVSNCDIQIAGHLATVMIYRYTGQDSLMAPSGHAETLQIGAVRWRNVSGQDVILWIASPYPKDLSTYRQLFWTVEFSKDAFGNQDTQ